MLDSLPQDWRRAALLGRLLTREGPTPILIRRGRVLDVSAFAATLKPAWESDEGAPPRLLSPVDLQCLKACGVTFAVSALERVIEERARGDISRDPLELIGQTIGRHHQYPDGFAPYLGTMFAPVADRDVPGLGFTHRRGDLVRIASERLGTLANRLTHCEHAPPWTQGIGALMSNLARRGLLEPK